MASASSAVREVASYCRICTAHCGTILTIDEGSGRLLSVKGDKNDSQTLGFICSKGANAPEFHHGSERLLHPLRREQDGSFTRISLATAFEEIGARFAAIYGRDGPDAIGTFRGSGGFYNSIMLGLLTDWMTAIGSPKAYSTLTIDQSAKTIVPSRLGYWAAGKQRFQDSDVALLIGANPLVSITQLDSRNPLKRIKEQKARGLKLIVIDPRRTETAEHADLFVQPFPGQDGPIIAAVIRIILDNGWHDREFCDENVSDLDLLREAVSPFEPEAVARAAGLDVEDLFAIARLFARDSKRGTASSGTGPDMAPHSNVTEHLIECLNVICGRMLRAGERISNSGFLFPAGSVPAQAMHMPRTWETGPRNRINGFGLVGGEMATSAMADDILQPGDGQLKALFVFGGNPASCVPDQRKMVQALRSLELLVTIDPFMTPTAEVSDYVLPPLMFYERPDLPCYIFETFLYPEPFTRYAETVLDRPADSDLCTEWDLLLDLARRVGKPITYLGHTLDPETPPTDEALLAIASSKALLPFEVIKEHKLGCVVDGATFALPKDPASAGHFTTIPSDVRDEIEAMRRDWQAGAPGAGGLAGFPLLLTSRRQRHRYNSVGFKIADLKRAMPFNPVYLNPQDLDGLAIRDGQMVEICSDAGRIVAMARADATMRTGVVSICHGFGGLPDDDDYLDEGVSPNLLISTSRDLQTINGMPRMSGIPVRVAALNDEPIR